MSLSIGCLGIIDIVRGGEGGEGGIPSGFSAHPRISKGCQINAYVVADRCQCECR